MQRLKNLKQNTQRDRE